MTVTEGGEACPAWYALAVRSNCEFRVRDSLRLRGFEEYLPTYSERVRWSDRGHTTTRVLFPGYVFARFALEYRLRVLAITAVAHILGVGADPSPVSESELAAIRTLVETANQTGRLVQPCGIPEIGNKVRIQTGLFRGLEGYVLRKKGYCRLVVALGLLNRAVAVELDSDSVHTIPETKAAPAADGPPRC